MIRGFKTNDVRKVEELEGLWEFGVVEHGRYPGASFEYSHKLAVPGCWEMHPDFLSYRGKAAYRKVLNLESGSSLRLTFKGVSHSAIVFFDGIEVVRHHNAYTPFSVVLPHIVGDSHEVVLVADNSFDGQSALHVPNDYFTYGGPIRPVVLEVLKEAFIELTFFQPTLSQGVWKAAVQAHIRRLTKSDNLVLRLSIFGNSVEVPVAFSDESDIAMVSTELTGLSVQPWSPDKPVLYFLESKLISAQGLVIDDLIDRVGFRVIALIDGKLLLNGTPIILKGFNRHEDHPQVGSAIPFVLINKDVDLIIEAGANAVRTSHYPNDERFLDLCDERGLLVWEENHARGLSLEQMFHPDFENQCEAVNREMLTFHFNHPSIVVWGLLNECASNKPAGRTMYARQFEQLRSLDGSRPVTFASCHHADDLCHDLSDIVSLNLYAGWYEEVSPQELLNKTLSYVDAVSGTTKPVIISEFGADAFYGYRDQARVRGSEERQGDILAENLDAFLEHPRVIGVFIWQFCDCRTHDGGGWFVTRGRSHNNKGVFDEYRRPKLALDVVKKYFRRGSGSS